MRRVTAIILLLGSLSAITAGIACHGGETARAGRDRRVQAFIAILPDSIDSEHRLEIDQLFNTFYLRADRGLVSPEDVERIEGELDRHVNRRRITPTELVRFMADVGYTAYKGDPNYNLPDSTVDHPVLNPRSAMYPMGFGGIPYDSAFWADFEKWRMEHPELRDSTWWRDISPPSED